MKLLLTGSSGLIGKALAGALGSRGVEVIGFDKKEIDRDGKLLDVRNAHLVTQALAGCDGIIHLAAVSRVIWGERDPALCSSVNVEGTRTVYNAAAASPRRPFVLFASSREVYGRPDRLPVTEDMPLRPLNVYGRSKCEGEKLSHELAKCGLNVAIVRFSNVYGSTRDHHDRVIPAFARQAAMHGKIRVEGTNCLFDFTHVDDVVAALVQTIQLLANGTRLPALHFTSGVGTTLGELASMALALSHNSLSIAEAPPRGFDVDCFTGDPRRAMNTVGWDPSIDLSTGFSRLVRDFQALTRRLDHALQSPLAAQGSGEFVETVSSTRAADASLA